MRELRMSGPRNGAEAEPTYPDDQGGPSAGRRSFFRNGEGHRGTGPEPAEPVQNDADDERGWWHRKD
jgi:hypothetical protein